MATQLQFWEFCLRLGSGLMLGTLVGLERQWRQRMAGTRTNALVAAGASAFVMCAFLSRDPRSDAQIVSYVVSGVGFLGAGVIFKDAGSVRGLNTAATIWCSAAIGAICGLGYMHYAAAVTFAVLLTNIVLRPLAYRLHPNRPDTSGEQETDYSVELVCRNEDEAHIRALLLQSMMGSALSLTGLRSEDIEGTSKLRVSAHLRAIGRQDHALETMVSRLSLEAGVTSVSWALTAQAME